MAKEVRAPRLSKSVAPAIHFTPLVRQMVGGSPVSTKPRIMQLLLPSSFYARDALDVASDLLGGRPCRRRVARRVTVAETYRWPGDTANHGRHGRTVRNEALRSTNRAGWRCGERTRCTR